MTFGMLLQFFLLNFLLYHTTLAECPDGSIESFDGDTCYLYERFPAQFVTAERLCRDSHGHLASVSDLFDNDFIAQGGVEAFEVMQVPDFWIGANDLEKRDQWEWIDHANFNYKNWAAKQPVNDSRSFCSALKLEDGKWQSQSCYESKPYVCKLPAPARTHTPERRPNHKTTPLRSTRHHQRLTTQHHASPNTTQHICDEGYSYLKATDLCYKVVSDANECYSDQAHEASIHNKRENEFVGGLAAKLAKKGENVKVRLSLAQYHQSKKDKLIQEGGTQVKPWLMPPSTWGVNGVIERRQYFNNLRNKHPKKHEGNGFIWFDGSSVDFTNWSKNEPKKHDEFTCAQLNTCYKECKKQKSNQFVWSSTDCLKAENAVCSKTPNRH